MVFFAAKLILAITLAANMAWQAGWSLLLGFFLSAIIQVFVPAARIVASLGGGGVRAIGVATLVGAASSSCSYAASAVARAIFAKGAPLTVALAFLLASTNLVIELGLVLIVLMGWPFALGEWLGGLVLVAIMTLLTRLTLPAAWEAEARRHAQASLPAPSIGPGSAAAGKPGRASVTGGIAWREVARVFTIEATMLWKELLAGFAIAGLLAAFVPASAWQRLFVTSAGPVPRAALDAFIGPVAALLSFVCSIGNVPMAAVLWGSGVSFAGVLSFLYADLIVLPLLQVYAKYFGKRMAAYIGAVFYLTMALSAIVVNVAFATLGLIPARPHMMPGMMMAASWHGPSLYLTPFFAMISAGLIIWARLTVPASPVPQCHPCHGANAAPKQKPPP
jgi:uncharacterized membrane protein YraQ (UPF0718 family)